jgi:hypothetical protein
MEYLWLLNSYHEWVYKHMHGDKDTFLLAFSMAGRRDMFTQVRVAPSGGGGYVWILLLVGRGSWMAGVPGSAVQPCSDLLYKHMHGDKDTLLLAFSMAGRRDMFTQVRV